jgi:cytoskeleton protein RodZ
MTDTIGRQLRQVREAHSVSLEQVSHATRIRLHYLRSIEAGDFAALPSLAQARGFVRAYASYLGLDPQALAEQLSQEIPVSAVKMASPQGSLPSTAIDSGEAHLILKEIGEKLKNQRELLDLSLEDAERHTHIRMRYLSAIESGDHLGLPSPVQGRGMLNNYAGFLGLDPEPLLLKYAESLQAGLAARQGKEGPRGAPAGQKGKKRFPMRFFSTDFVLGGVVALFMMGFVIWGGLRVFNIQNEIESLPATITPLPVSDILLGGTPTPVQTFANETGSNGQETPSAGLPLEGEPGSENTLLTPGNGVPEAQETPVSPPAGDNSAIQIYVIIKQRTWLKVTVDGKVQFEGRVVPGSAYPYYGDIRVEVVAGNGAALQIFYNQAEIGPLGMFGEITHLIFTTEGVQTPTPTITPTGMPPPTRTQTPEGFIEFTPTPSPTPETEQ